VPARLSGPKREVEVLQVDEVALVEPAERLEQLAPHQVERADDVVHAPAVPVIPLAHDEAGERAGKQPVHARRGRDQLPGRGEPRAAARDPPLLVHQLNPADADVRAGFTLE
jgi:hypothetical protein